MGKIKVGDKVNISAEVIGICGNLYNDTVELRLDNGYRINIPISAINEERENKRINENTDPDDNTDNYIFIDSENSAGFLALDYINGTTIRAKREKPQIEYNSDWLNQTLQESSRLESIQVPVKIKVKNLIKNFSLQAGDVHFTYRKDWLILDKKFTATVTGAIYSKEVCSFLYNDLLFVPVNNLGKEDLDETYDYVLLDYLFNLPENEIDNNFNLKNYMLDKNSFLRIYPVYKDANEKISIGKRESICATTETVWNKYRFKDALEVYDKTYNTDWASKLDMPNIKGE